MRQRQASLQIVTVLLAISGGIVPAAAQPNVTVTQHQALPTPDNGSPEAHNKKQPVYRLLGFSLRGTTRVDTAALVATLPEHEGDVITNAEIRENVEKISHVLQAKHVHGYITTMILQREGPGHHVFVMWDVQLEDALSYVPLRGPRHFASQTFAGNVKLSTAALIAATNLHPGDKIMDGRVGDARTGIEQAYDKAMPGAAVDVSGKIKLTKDNSVLIAWKIVEPK
jgi:outer membrane protein assembly factor BamA